MINLYTSTSDIVPDFKTEIVIDGISCTISSSRYKNLEGNDAQGYEKKEAHKRLLETSRIKDHIQ